MPFGFVQIAPFRYGGQDPANCAELWEAQLLTLQEPPEHRHGRHHRHRQHPGHPPEEQAGRGQAAGALGPGDRLRPEGPGLLRPDLQVDDGRGQQDPPDVRPRRQRSDTRDGKAPTDFTIAGADQKFLPAIAAIDGNAVVVHSDDVKEPVAVRFAWYDTAMPNLCNKEGLPASPFRTDQWKGLTEGKQLAPVAETSVFPDRVGRVERVHQRLANVGWWDSLPLGPPYFYCAG